MLKAGQCLRLAALLTLLTVQDAGADLLFTNFDGAPLEGGPAYTGGGSCTGSCYGIADNFRNDVLWDVTGFTFYIMSPVSAANLESGGRFALFTAAGAQVVAPTNTATTVTATGLTNTDFGWPIYKLEISGLSIALVPGEYQFRFTNTNEQSIYPAYGTASAQAIDPGFVQLSGALGGDSLLPEVTYQHNENWAFQVSGTSDKVFSNGFEAP